MSRDSRKRKRNDAEDGDGKAEEEETVSTETYRRPLPIPDELVVLVLRNLPFRCAWIGMLSTCRYARFVLAARKDVSKLCIDLAYEATLGYACRIPVIAASSREEGKEPTAIQHFEDIVRTTLRVCLVFPCTARDDGSWPYYHKNPHVQICIGSGASHNWTRKGTGIAYWNAACLPTSSPPLERDGI